MTEEEVDVVCQALRSHAKICDAVAEKTNDPNAKAHCRQQAACCRHIVRTFNIGANATEGVLN